MNTTPTCGEEVDWKVTPSIVVIDVKNQTINGVPKDFVKYIMKYFDPSPVVLMKRDLMVDDRLD